MYPCSYQLCTSHRHCSYFSLNPSRGTADHIPMEVLKAEIECLKHTEPPVDYSVDTISNWLESLKAAPDEAAVHLLIERIDKKTKPSLTYRVH